MEWLFNLPSSKVGQFYPAQSVNCMGGLVNRHKLGLCLASWDVWSLYPSWSGLCPISSHFSWCFLCFCKVPKCWLISVTSALVHAVPLPGMNVLSLSFCQCSLSPGLVVISAVFPGFHGHKAVPLYISYLLLHNEYLKTQWHKLTRSDSFCGSGIWNDLSGWPCLRNSQEAAVKIPAGAVVIWRLPCDWRIWFQDGSLMWMVLVVGGRAQILSMPASS
jgi:hypothetical protein